MIKSTKLEKDINAKDKTTIDLSLHSQEIRDNLSNVNMEAWYYIYENFVNPPPTKNKA